MLDIALHMVRRGLGVGAAEQRERREEGKNVRGRCESANRPPA
jgi:hypothetical protein